MNVDYQITADENDIIARCHAWLDDETIDICQSIATSVADDITGREDAEAILMNILSRSLFGTVARQDEGTKRVESKSRGRVLPNLDPSFPSH